MDSGTTKKSLTPAELFDYRLAALLGYADIDEMKRSMTQRSYLGWQRYWDKEPWGPWRDNIHTAIIARELRRPQVRRGTRIPLEQFFVRDPEERRQEGINGFFGFLQAVAKQVTEPVKRRRARRKERK